MSWFKRRRGPRPPVDGHCPNCGQDWTPPAATPRHAATPLVIDGETEPESTAAMRRYTADSMPLFDRPPKYVKTVWNPGDTDGPCGNRAFRDRDYYLWETDFFCAAWTTSANVRRASYVNFVDLQDDRGPLVLP